MIGKFSIHFPSHTAPGVQLGFISTSHVGCPQEFAPKAALEDWVLPREAQVWRWVQLLDSQVLWQLQVCRGAGGQGVGRHGSLWVFSSSGSSAAVGIYCSSDVAAWNTGPLTVPSTQGARSTGTGDMVLLGFFQASGTSASLRIKNGSAVQLFGLQDFWQCQVQGPWQTQEQELWAVIDFF